MRWSRVLAPTWSLLLVISAPAAFGQGNVKARTGIAVWDTGHPAGVGLPLAKDGWTVIAPDKTASAFKGDVVVSNGRIVAVMRQKDAVVELHAAKAEAAVPRLRLRLQTVMGEPAVSLERMALIENGKGGATLQATFKTAKGVELAAKFRIKKGDVAMQVEPGIGAGKLRVECPGRFVVLPDFFADDITLDAVKLPLTSVDLPSENFVLHLTGGGDSIAMCVFENRQQDVKVTLAGKGKERQVTGSEIGFEKKKIWVALLEAPQIWHAHELTPADTGKVVNLDWKMPFRAQWRVDFTRPGDMTDSWEMLLQDKGYVSYMKPSYLGREEEVITANRERWNTVLGTFSYPAWSDQEGRGYLQPIKSKKLQFTGPTLIYPLHRVKETPLDAFTVVDVMRNTLGVGPCEHILDLQSHKDEYRGMATCGVRDTLNPIYANKEQKSQRAHINKTLDDGLIFVKHIRSRINDYIAFGKKMRTYLAEQKKARPESAEFIAEMDKLTAEIDSRVAVRVEKIKTPEHVAKLMAEFRKNVLDYEGPDAEKRCKAFTYALWEVGDNQDELSGELRLAVRTLRQRAAIAVALDPRVAPIATEIRARTQEVLRNPAWHEGARH
jgi:hypothetical protein